MYRAIPYVRLFFLGCAYGANTCAGTAVDASIGIYHIGSIVFGNRVHGAFSLTCTTFDAVFGNFISQSNHLLVAFRYKPTF
jgi:hypothetical protein